MSSIYFESLQLILTNVDWFDTLKTEKCAKYLASFEANAPEFIAETCERILFNRWNKLKPQLVTYSC